MTTLKTLLKRLFQYPGRAGRGERTAGGRPPHPPVSVVSAMLHRFAEEEARSAEADAAARKGYIEAEAMLRDIRS